MMFPLSSIKVKVFSSKKLKKKNFVVAFWINNLIGTSIAVSKENVHCSNPHPHLLSYQKENESGLTLERERGGRRGSCEKDQGNSWEIYFPYNFYYKFSNSYRSLFFFFLFSFFGLVI